jgi:hypothetical protein
MKRKFKILNGQNTLEGKAANPPVTHLELFTLEVTCPYCLFSDYISKFTLRKKSGQLSEKSFQCPDCKNIMRHSTLINEIITLENYASWVCNIQEHDIDHRLKWDKIKERLRNIRASSAFWKAYYAKKDELHPELAKWREYEKEERLKEVKKEDMPYV